MKKNFWTGLLFTVSLLCFSQADAAELLNGNGTLAVSGISESIMAVDCVVDDDSLGIAAQSGTGTVSFATGATGTIRLNCPVTLELKNIGSLYIRAQVSGGATAVADLKALTMDRSTNPFNAFSSTLGTTGGYLNGLASDVLGLLDLDFGTTTVARSYRIQVTMTRTSTSQTADFYMVTLD